MIWELSQEPGGNVDEWNWNKTSALSFELVDTRTGERKPAKINFPYLLSASGKYLIGQDTTKQLPLSVNNDIFTCELSTGAICNITKMLPPDSEESGYLSVRHKNYMLAGWLNNDDEVLIYDKYDIWLVDPRGRKRLLT